jgi:NAD(P)-dependent dehydrogenase (short-subunit alcohol dehydrogenase family)
MVTGANSGIGKATALGLAQLSASVPEVKRHEAKSRRKAVIALLISFLRTCHRNSPSTNLWRTSSNATHNCMC